MVPSPHPGRPLVLAKAVTPITALLNNFNSVGARTPFALRPSIVIYCSAPDYSDLSRRAPSDAQRRRWSSSFQELDFRSDADFVVDENANTSTCPEENNVTIAISTYSGCGLLKDMDSEIGILRSVRESIQMATAGTRDA